VCEVVDERRDVGGEEGVDQGWEMLGLSAELSPKMSSRYTNMTRNLLSISSDLLQLMILRLGAYLPISEIRRQTVAEKSSLSL
jgi:hypothetical protein